MEFILTILTNRDNYKIFSNINWLQKWLKKIKVVK